MGFEPATKRVEARRLNHYATAPSKRMALITLDQLASTIPEGSCDWLIQRTRHVHPPYGFLQHERIY